MRIRRARLRQAAAAVVVAAIAVGSGLGIAPMLDRSAVNPAAESQPFPASFTASDGAYYWRVAVTSLALSTQKSASIKLKVGSYPVDVMLTCGGVVGRGVAAAGIAVNGTGTAAILCPEAQQLVALPVRLGGEADITFTKITMAKFPTAGGSLRFAVYEWKPPAVAQPAPQAPRLPSSYTGNNTTSGHGTVLRREIASRSGDWPADRTFMVTVPFRRGNVDISVACSGAIGERLTITTEIKDQGRTFPGPQLQCRSWVPGTAPPDTSDDGGRVGVPETITFRLQAPSPAADYALRAASWTIALYEEQS
ncbi:MAG: hypothetical protein M3Z75_07240 [Actinomycetota bacterium]|nr:hypothetical protein [Actinomycetota bacterium]